MVIANGNFSPVAALGWSGMGLKPTVGAVKKRSLS
jgi:hypothetical protein